MPEQVVNDPLQGREIKQIILARVEDALNRDCTLVDDIAYAGFKVNFDLKLGFLRSQVHETLVWGSVQQGEKVEVSEAIVESYETDSPNGAREDHDLPMPVVVKGPNGPERKFVKGIPKRGPGRPKKNS